MNYNMNNNLNDMLFITAYKDIDRKSWIQSSRTNEEYFEYFFNLIKDFEYNLVVYVEDDVCNKILSRINLNNASSNFILKNFNSVNTFLKKYLENDKRIISSDIYKNKIPNERKNHPEHLYSEYNLLNHSKINFISDARKSHPYYEFYSWIDFGYVRCEQSIPRNINISKLPQKMIFHTFFKPTHYIDPNIMLTSYDVYLTGGAYIIHSSCVNKFEELYDKKLAEWQENYITDDDQNLMLQLYFENTDLFFLFQSNAWFSLYNII
jgi:hypothetical protein